MNASDDGKNEFRDGKNASDDRKNDFCDGKNASDDGKNDFCDGMNASDDGIGGIWGRIINETMDAIFLYRVSNIWRATQYQNLSFSK